MAALTTVILSGVIMMNHLKPVLANADAVKINNSKASVNHAAIDKARQNINDAQSKVDFANKKVNQQIVAQQQANDAMQKAQNDVNTKQDTLNTDQGKKKQYDEQQNNVVDLQKQADSKKEALNDAEKQVDIVRVNIENATNGVSTAQDNVNNFSQQIKKDKKDLDNAQKDLDNVQRNFDVKHNYPSLPKDTKITDSYFLGDMSSETNILEWSSSDWSSFVQKMKIPSYIDNEAAKQEKINVIDLTSSQNKQLQDYFGKLENSVLHQLGLPESYENSKTATEYAKRVAYYYGNDNWIVRNKENPRQNEHQDEQAINLANKDMGMRHNWVENVADTIDTPDNGIKSRPNFNPNMTMNDAMHKIYDAFIKQLTGNGLLKDNWMYRWNEAGNLLESQKTSPHVSKPVSYWGVSYDSLGQIHFLRLEVPTVSDGSFPSMDIFALGGGFDTSGSEAPIIDSIDEDSDTQSINEYQTYLSNAQTELSRAQSEYDDANTKLKEFQNNLQQENYNLLAAQNAQKQVQSEYDDIQAKLQVASDKLKSMPAIFQDKMHQDVDFLHDSQSILLTAKNDFYNVSQRLNQAKSSLQVAKNKLSKAQNYLVTLQKVIDNDASHSNSKQKSIKYYITQRGKQYLVTKTGKKYVLKKSGKKQILNKIITKNGKKYFVGKNGKKYILRRHPAKNQVKPAPKKVIRYMIKQHGKNYFVVKQGKKYILKKNMKKQVLKHIITKHGKKYFVDKKGKKYLLRLHA
jgi:SEC10/PgrA surface exclusion-like protein